METVLSKLIDLNLKSIWQISWERQKRSFYVEQNSTYYETDDKQDLPLNKEKLAIDNLFEKTNIFPVTVTGVLTLFISPS